MHPKCIWQPAAFIPVVPKACTHCDWYLSVPAKQLNSESISLLPQVSTELAQRSSLFVWHSEGGTEGCQRCHVFPTFLSLNLSALCTEGDVKYSVFLRAVVWEVVQGWWKKPRFSVSHVLSCRGRICHIWLVQCFYLHNRAAKRTRAYAGNNKTRTDCSSSVRGTACPESPDCEGKQVLVQPGRSVVQELFREQHPRVFRTKALRFHSKVIALVPNCCSAPFTGHWAGMTWECSDQLPWQAVTMAGPTICPAVPFDFFWLFFF